MAKSYADILTEQFERHQQARSYYMAELEAGRLTDDTDRINNASDGILALDASEAHLHQRANQFVASQQAQKPANAYGLSDTEIEIAKASHSGGTPEQRVQSYAYQKSRLARMRATREYDDTQGQVFKR